MADQTEKPKLGTRPPLGLKRTVETGKVKQSFSHGRSNTVVVEVKKRRILGRPGEAPPAETAEEEQPAPKPRRGRSKKAAAAEAEQVAPAAPEPTPPPAANNDVAEDSDEPRRSGWWQRTFG